MHVIKKRLKTAYFKSVPEALGRVPGVGMHQAAASVMQPVMQGVMQGVMHPVIYPVIQGVIYGVIYRNFSA